MRTSSIGEASLREWLGWSAFVGFTGLGVIVGSIVYYLTVKLNPQFALGLKNPLLLFLYSTLFYGFAGAVTGLLLGLVFWMFISRSDSPGRARLPGGVIVALLILGPLGWVISTSHVSLTLYALKGKLIHMAGWGMPLSLIGIFALLVIVGYVLMGPLSRFALPLRTILIIYPVCFLLAFFLVKRFDNIQTAPSQNTTGVDYSAKGTGIKFIIIGLDCADWDVIEPLMEAGKLPAFTKLKEEGVSADLKTFIPTLSPSLWTSISTGMSAEKHGVRNFYITALPLTNVPIRLFPGGFGLNFRIMPFLNNSGLVPRLIKMNTSNMKSSPDLWDIFSRFGRRVGVLDYMITWPAEEVNGFMVSDLLLRYVYEFGLQGLDAAEGLAYPPELIQEVREILTGIVPGKIDMNFIRGKLISDDCNLPEDNPFIKLLTMKLWRDESVWALCKELYRSHKPGLLVNYTSAIDGTNHVFKQFIYSSDRMDTEWECFHEILDRWYQYEDSRILELLNMADDSTCVVVVSDHGWDEEGLNHENGPDGVFVMWGAGIKKGIQLKHAGLLDIAPTILACAGYPVASDMEGKILKEALSEELLRRFPPQYVESYTEEVAGEWQPIEMDPVLDKQIREELEVLGYIK